MKVVILGDLHIGVSKGNEWVKNNQRLFFENVLYPYIEENNITEVIQTGDWFDNRDALRHDALEFSNQIINNMPDCVENIRVLVGNHDMHMRERIWPNSIDEHLSLNARVRGYSVPTQINIDGMNIDLIPWICQDNYERVMQHIGVTSSDVCIGHFELTGFRFYPGNIATTGMDSDFLSPYKKVLSGHYHTPHSSSDDHITYVGTPYTLTFNDAGDRRGFHILDTETLELEFIENPVCHHEVFEFDADEYTPGELEIDNAELVNLSVKVSNPVNKKRKIDWNPISEKIGKLYHSMRVEYTDDVTSTADIIAEIDDSEIGTKGTGDYINTYVETLELDEDAKKRVDKIANSLYHEALSQM